MVVPNLARIDDMLKFCDEHEEGAHWSGERAFITLFAAPTNFRCFLTGGDFGEHFSVGLAIDETSLEPTAPGEIEARAQMREERRVPDGG